MGDKFLQNDDFVKFKDSDNNTVYFRKTSIHALVVPSPLAPSGKPTVVCTGVNSIVSNQVMSEILSQLGYSRIM